MVHAKLDGAAQEQSSSPTEMKMNPVHWLNYPTSLDFDEMLSVKTELDGDIQEHSGTHTSSLYVPSVDRMVAAELDRVIKEEPSTHTSAPAKPVHRVSFLRLLFLCHRQSMLDARNSLGLPCTATRNRNRFCRLWNIPIVLLPGCSTPTTVICVA